MMRPRTVWFILPALVLAAGTLTAHAAASGRCYLQMGGIRGEITAKGREGWIRVQAVEYHLNRSTTSRLAAKFGFEKRPHSLRFTKALDRASPQIARKVRKGSKIRKMTLRFFVRPKAGAPEVHRFTLVLSNITITATHVRSNKETDGVPLETVEVDYESLELISESGGTKYIFEE